VSEDGHNAYERARRQKAAMNGKCTKCKARPVIRGFRQCSTCRGRENRQRAILREHGICTRCRTRRLEHGYKLCSDCRSYLANVDRSAKRLRSSKRWRYLTKVTRAAKQYVYSLRELESVTSTPARPQPDHPGLMAATRMQVQSAVRQLFAAVERRA
jgi:hypothetical protein